MNLEDGIKLAESLKYFDESVRLETFKSWPFSKEKPCNAQKMAEAGFIFIGNKREPDAVKCFTCDKSLDGWEETDDPWKEHLKHSKTCSFAKLQKPQDLVTLAEFWDFKSSFVQSKIRNFYKQKIIDAVQVYDGLIEELSAI